MYQECQGEWDGNAEAVFQLAAGGLGPQTNGLNLEVVIQLPIGGSSAVQLQQPNTQVQTLTEFVKQLVTKQLNPQLNVEVSRNAAPQLNL